jgi:hypothetical protein
MKDSSFHVMWMVGLENQNYPNMHTKKAIKYVGKKQRSCRLTLTPLTENTRNPPTYLW